jgi:hypothetical protein
MFYLIYQAGKVASQTLEWTIRTSDPIARIERHHHMAPEQLAEFDRLCALEKPGSKLLTEYQHQIAAARTAAAAFEHQDPHNAWVLTGFRDPLDFSISAFFQNLSDIHPRYSSPSPGEAYDRDRFDEEVERVIGIFNREYQAFMERVRAGNPAPGLRDRELRLKLSHIGEWFDVELKPFLGIDAYEYDVAGKPFICVRTKRANFLMYRMETLRESLPALLQQLPLSGSSVQLINRNIGAEKDYAVLYNRFRERFTPTAEMMEYYYGGRFFRHFYGDSKPLYQEGRRGMQAPD